MAKRFLLLCDLNAVREACQLAKELLSTQGMEGSELAEWDLLIAEGINKAANYVGDDGCKQLIEVEIALSNHGFPEWLQNMVDSFGSPLNGMTEELASCYESFSAIFHFSPELGQAQ
ncbi:MAG: hypothetical protein M2R45_05198 [Verrucomicrobia subdivision 3 bacterium]|nr:hypothetical protein [Limisphaerales bacterium]MCS1417579.1 hypothetical protein [Limisphaerales bacterium]